MEIKTFDTYLTELCDNFDSLIAPRTMARSNTNIIYLMFKAVAKGFEIINNVCVALSNKFNPALCSTEDLDSIASMVGTKRLEGSATGLRITATNEGETAKTLLAGTYTYSYDDDLKFTFTLLADVAIPAGSYARFIAMSNTIGQYIVTEQPSITVEANVAIPDEITFSCLNNTNLLGRSAETDIAFRNRILTGYTGQDSVVELENTLKNLPYLFDCKVVFNNTSSEAVYDGITVPPFYAVIFYSGDARNEIADIIADKLICPTVQATGSVEVTYTNDTLTSGSQSYYLVPFGRTEFGVEIKYKINLQFLSEEEAQTEITKACNAVFSGEVHSFDYITEDDFYNIIAELNLAGFLTLDITLLYSGEPVSYISVPASRIPSHNSISFVRVEV